MNIEELLSNKKEYNNSQDLLKDLLAGDPDALKRFDDMNLDMKAIKAALTFLTQNNDLSSTQKTDLLQESWRVNFRAKPPTPEEFLTEKYIGYTAKSLYPRVQKAFKEFLNPTSGYRNLILYPHIGWGKLLQYNELVATPLGFTKIKDIKPGDEVCTASGKITTVKNIQDYPQEKIYKINFSDGRVSFAGGPHFWKAAYHGNKNGALWKIITTEEIVKDIKNNPSHKWFIPLCEPAYHNERKHIIDPYTIGALLGDGYFGKKQITLVGDDKEVLKEAASLEGNLLSYENNKKYTVNFKKVNSSLISEIERLGLSDTKSNTKFIPEEYLYDSIENRIALLQGLMDTDGTVENKGPNSVKSKRRPHASFWTSSERLKNDFCLLIQGLGGIARVYKRTRGKKSTCNYDAYVITVSFPENKFPLFKLERKQKYIDEEYNRERGYKEKAKPQFLHIKSIELTDDIGGCCIETNDDEHLFLTNNYIVTHNSFLSTLITLYLDVCVSLMRDPSKYFGLSKATSFSSMLVSYSLKKSYELLVGPFTNILESSPYFEKVMRRDAMQDLVEEFKQGKPVDKLYYTTASKDKSSVLEFDSGLSVKVASSPQALLGLTLISVTFSELAFFTDAGKALDLNEEILMGDWHTTKRMGDLKIGDIIAHPTVGTTEITNIPWQGEGDLYEIELDDGRTVKCHENHLWPVTFWKDNIFYDEIVTTKYMIENPEIEFNFKSI